MSVAAGCVLPVPGVRTLDARPDGVFAALAGGAATSDGGVATETFGSCADRGDAISRDTAMSESIRMSQGSFRSSILPVISCRAPHDPHSHVQEAHAESHRRK